MPGSDLFYNFQVSWSKGVRQEVWGEVLSFSNYFHSFHEKFFLPLLQKFFFADLFETSVETLILLLLFKKSSVFFHSLLNSEESGWTM